MNQHETLVNLTKAYEAIEKRLDEIAEQYDIWMPETLPQAIRFELEQLEKSELELRKAIISLPTEDEVDLLSNFYED